MYFKFRQNVGNRRKILPQSLGFKPSQSFKISYCEGGNQIRKKSVTPAVL